MDDSTIADYGLVHGCTVHVVLRIKGGFQILIRTLDEKTFAIDASANETVLRLKQRIQDKTSFDVDRQRIIHAGTQSCELF